MAAARGWLRKVAAVAGALPGGGGPGRAPGPAPDTAAPATAALYVHWPYCRKRCSYCNFNTYVVPAVDEAAVRACLVREAQTLLRLSQVHSVTSVFFGGGTPSLASPGTVAAVLEAVAGAAHLPAGAEVTLEANPSSTSASALDGFRAAGVNRLSIGVQSLDDTELRMLGREHTAAEARKAVEAARGLFPGRTSIDLLFGLPGQSRDAWAQRLEATLRLCDDHISLYQLTLERGTALAAQVRGGALPAPPQDLLADMYQTARNVLVAAGFRHYEVSNFARKGALSTHNLSYWRAEQYIGVGPAQPAGRVWGAGGGSGTAARGLACPGQRVSPGSCGQGRGSPWGRGSHHHLFPSGLRCTWAGLAVLDSLLPDLLWQLQRVLGAARRPPRGAAGERAGGGARGL
ncbi:radical S-adenosyl methionine domain-containing protein 1, mitochondrial isoform X4 [Camarhynchus parvulus]|uniref:radical S-adenosyl methionine domain-containing protein 1, mitochondrial isoform X4 n=1 Tax=Geospiza parvula TaxID=87175 RepID=UPI00123820D1|nr:radical S-adenosyl methionine domain-containing protein 1, mitochondrial isoform X4 [Camarhynchus parvulus]